MENHLIIGIGGTGGKIIKALRKNIYQDYKNEIGKKLKLGYIYVDSSDEMMKDKDAQWKVLGHSVELSQASKVLISGQNLRTRLDNLSAYPELKYWLGDVGKWGSFIETNATAVVGGQRRRLGRFLLASSLGLFDTALKHQIKELTENRVPEITFHICCGISGGTGSGCLIDILSYVRSTNHKAKIILYLQMPEKQPGAKNSGYYHANAYAALLELNALNVAEFKPFDISGKSGVNSDLVDDKRLALPNPVYNGCYLFSDTSGNTIRFDIDKTMPSLVAEFLKQKIVTLSWLNEDLNNTGSGTGSYVKALLDRQENGENGNTSPEKGNLPETKDQNERDIRFLSLGIKLITIPEIEIAEYLTAKMAYSTYSQIIYNNFLQGNGYINQVKPHNIETEVQQKLQKWHISKEYLIYSKSLLFADDEEKYKEIESYWDIFASNVLSNKNTKDKASWHKELLNAYDGNYKTNFRKIGVENFYLGKSKKLSETSDYVIQEIEKDFLDNFYNGSLGIEELCVYFLEIKNALNKEKSFLENDLKSLAENIARQNGIVNAKFADFTNSVTGLTGLFTSADRKLSDINEAVKNLYILKTKQKGVEYAIQLIPYLIKKLDQVYNSLNSFKSKLIELQSQAETDYLARLVDGHDTDDNRYELRLFNKAVIDKKVKSWLEDKNIVGSLSNEVRKETEVKNTSLVPSIERFCLENSPERLKDLVDVTCADRVLAENNLITNPSEKVLGKSIIDELALRFPNDDKGGSIEPSPDLKAEASGWMRKAGLLNVFDTAEEAIPVVQKPLTQSYIVFPSDNSKAGFVNKLAQAFKDGKPSYIDEVSIEQHQNQVKRNELLVLTIKNYIRPRYLEDLKVLESEYLKLVNSQNSKQAEEAKILLHLEGDGSSYPPLYIQVPKIGDSIPYLLLATAMGIVSIEEFHGSPQYIYIERDENDLQMEVHSFGKTINTPLQPSQERSANLVRFQVAKKLANKGNLTEGDISKYITLLKQTLATEKELLSLKETDSDFKTFSNNTIKAIELLKK